MIIIKNKQTLDIVEIVLDIISQDELFIAI